MSDRVHPNYQGMLTIERGAAGEHSTSTAGELHDLSEGAADALHRAYQAEATEDLGR